MNFSELYFQNIQKLDARVWNNFRRNSLGECFSINNPCVFKARKADENFSIENFQILSKSHRGLKRIKFPNFAPQVTTVTVSVVAQSQSSIQAQTRP